jgi:hypothetical protein
MTKTIKNAQKIENVEQHTNVETIQLSSKCEKLSKIKNS